jgi:hypothetical protein
VTVTFIPSKLARFAKKDKEAKDAPSPEDLRWVRGARAAAPIDEQSWIVAWSERYATHATVCRGRLNGFSPYEKGEQKLPPAGAKVV